MSTKRTTAQTKRRANQLRSLRITRHYIDNAAGSVLIEMGQTRVLCNASFVNELPRWREESGLGWVTAEYSMLPAATSPRKPRSRTGHTDGRGMEIQRLVGRVLRAVVDFEKLGPNTIYFDCDVLQADGGTRTAAINGCYVALVDAVRYGLKEGFITENPIKSAYFHRPAAKHISKLIQLATIRRSQYYFVYHFYSLGAAWTGSGISLMNGNCQGPTCNLAYIFLT